MTGWALRFNMEKTEVCGYDYGSDRELDVSLLRLNGQALKKLGPLDSFKYLGIRLSLAGGWDPEKGYVFAASREVVERLKGHSYSPAQICWVIGACVVSKFRYSCAFVDWRPEELEELASLWARAYRHAYKVPDSTPQCFFRGPSARSSFAIPEPVQVLCRETMGVLAQSLALDDDLRSEIQAWAQAELKGMGCCTWAEFEVEVKLVTSSSTAMPTLFHRLAWCASELRSSVDWGSMLGLSSLGRRGLVAQTQQERLNAASDKEPVQDWAKLLRMLVASGRWQEDQVVQHGRFCLPTSLRDKPSGNGEAARILAAHYGLPVQFVGPAGAEGPRVRAGDPVALVPCVGTQLLSGKVRWPAANGFTSGVVVAFCAASEWYTVRLAGGLSVQASLGELRQHWDNRPRAGPYADGKACAALQRNVLEIRAYRERQVWRREPSPWPRPQHSTE